MKQTDNSITRADKQVAISLLMTSLKKRYWDKPPKERLRRVEAIIRWFELRLPYWI